MFPLHSFVQEEAGATAIEYGLLASMIAVFLITAITVFGTSASTMWNSLSSHIQSATN